MAKQRLRADAILHLFAADGPSASFQSGAHKEVIGSPFPTQVIWWTSPAKTQKIVEKLITRNPQQLPTTIIFRVYDVDGVLRQTITDTIIYDGVIETSRNRAIT